MRPLAPIHLIRYGLPGAIALAGVVLLVLGAGNARSLATAAGITALGIALIILFVNVYVRMTMASESDRERELLARERYAQTGSWEPPVQPTAPAKDAPPAEAAPPAGAAPPAEAARAPEAHRTAPEMPARTRRTFRRSPTDRRPRRPN
jgi:hypothetical protein